MKIIDYIRQPHGTGFALFGLAAAMCVAIIISGQSGLAPLATTLSTIAQPICSAAIAVLMYLAILARKAETAAATITND